VDKPLIFTAKLLPIKLRKVNLLDLLHFLTVFTYDLEALLQGAVLFAKFNDYSTVHCKINPASGYTTARITSQDVYLGPRNI
jgi:hypothetical protein